MHGRRDERAAVTIPVALEERGREAFSPALNLSTSGVFLAGLDPPQVGASVRLVVSLPPYGLFVRMRGTVVRHASKLEPSGFAVRFDALDATTSSRLESFVSNSVEA